MQFPAKIISSCIWVAIPVDRVILHWYTCGVDGRSFGYGHVITRFSGMFRFTYPWCHAEILSTYIWAIQIKLEFWSVKKFHNRRKLVRVLLNKNYSENQNTARSMQQQKVLNTGNGRGGGKNSFGKVQKKKCVIATLSPPPSPSLPLLSPPPLPWQIDTAFQGE